MPIDKTINQPDGADSLGPKPPTNPVEFARWVTAQGESQETQGTAR